MLLIDGDFLMYLKERNTLEQMLHSVDTKIKQICKATKQNNFVLFLSGKNLNRKKVNSNYKANRKGDKPKFFTEIKEHLINEYNAVYKDGYEADDLISYNFRNNNCKATIASQDKDLLYNYQGRHFNCHYKKMKFEDYLTIEEANYNLAVQMLSGDKIDNIDSVLNNKQIELKYGVKGKIANKRAIKIINNGLKMGQSPFLTVMDVFILSKSDLKKQYLQICLGTDNIDFKVNVCKLKVNKEEDIIDTENDILFYFGKYKGMMLSELIEKDNNYIKWCINNITPDTKKMELFLNKLKKLYEL